jgi:ribose 5-phosphate isomerase B
MVIAIGSDHGGYNLKEEIKKMLDEQKIEYRDYGTHSPVSVDYPDIAQAVAQAVVTEECEKGILICGTGIGISIAANKIKGVRAALCHDEFSAQMAREHNNANILALGERVIGVGLALNIVNKWLEASFAGGRHAVRVDKIMNLEA